uniref:integrase arm-type DNA-binding domain-containing protein n=1 Tax=Klebsiella quasipneumoniae TaxID=1463165 RepID=UPI0035A03747
MPYRKKPWCKKIPNQLKYQTNTEYRLRDGDGLALLIKPFGRKIWFFKYTPPALKKRATISIGPHPAWCQMPMLQP